MEVGHGGAWGTRPVVAPVEDHGAPGGRSDWRGGGRRRDDCRRGAGDHRASEGRCPAGGAGVHADVGRAGGWAGDASGGAFAPGWPGRAGPGDRRDGAGGHRRLHRVHHSWTGKGARDGRQPGQCDLVAPGVPAAVGPAPWRARRRCRERASAPSAGPRARRSGLRTLNAAQARSSSFRTRTSDTRAISMPFGARRLRIVTVSHGQSRPSDLGALYNRCAAARMVRMGSPGPPPRILTVCAKGIGLPKGLLSAVTSSYLDAMEKIADAEEATLAAASSRDPEVGLRAVAALRGLVEVLEALQVENARSNGWSWQEIASRLGVSKQAVHQKHGPRSRAGQGR